MRAPRPVVAVAGGVLLALVLAGGGAYAYFFSGLRVAPGRLVISPPAPTSTPAASSPAAGAGLGGTWKVGTGSVAGYRAKELFAGTTTPHQAVARTTTVSGGMTVDQDGTTVSGVTVNAGLADLHSVDQVAGRDVNQRDAIVRRSLQTGRFPLATFKADTLPAPQLAGDGPAALSIPGTLTVAGHDKAVTATAQAQLKNGRLEVAGSVPALMTDFGVNPPSAPFVTVDPAITIEFDLFFERD